MKPWSKYTPCRGCGQPPHSGLGTQAELAGCRNLFPQGSEGLISPFRTVLAAAGAELAGHAPSEAGAARRLSLGHGVVPGSARGAAAAAAHGKWHHSFNFFGKFVPLWQVPKKTCLLFHKPGYSSTVGSNTIDTVLGYYRYVPARILRLGLYRYYIRYRYIIPGRPSYRPAT